MKKELLSLLVVGLLSISANAQTEGTQVEQKLESLEQQLQQLQELNDETQDEFQELRNRDQELQRGIYGLSNKNQELSSRLDSLNSSLIENNKAVQELNQQLTKQGKKLSGQIAKTRESTSQSVSELDDDLNKNTLYWIIAVLLVALLALFAFFFLRKKVSNNQSSLKESLTNTRKELEQEAIRLDEKLMQVMENQMKVLEDGNKSQSETQNNEPDHSLALKVADEIVRIEKNLERVDDQKRIKPLSKALDRIRANFEANGYEIVSLLNKKYDDRDEIDVINFKVDENINEGERVITRVVKPQIKFNGKLIQKGQVDVSQSE